METLATRTALLLSVIIGLLFAGATLVIYEQVQLRSEAAALSTLDSYAREIVRHQEDRFAAIAAVEVRARDLMLQQLAAAPDAAPAAFDRLFPLRADGTRRSVDGLFDGMTLPDGTPVRGIGAFIGNGRDVTPAHRRELMVAFRTIQLLGEGMSTELKSLFYFTPNNDLIMFAPSRPDRLTFYRKTAPASFDFQREEFMRNMLAANNAQRTMKCTALQPIVYDRTRRTWTTGCMLPVDDGGRLRGGWGISLLLDDVFNAARQSGLKDAKVILLSREGRLIYHPDFTHQADPSTQRYLDLTTATDPRLQALWAFVVANRRTGVAAGHLVALHGLAAMRPVPTPGWYAIAFYPDAALSSLPRNAARTVLAVGFVCLILQAAVVAYILRRWVGRPLADLTRRAEATRALAGSLPRANAGIAPPGRDEVERLNAAFDLMEQTVGAERERLTRSFDLLAHNVGEYAIYMLDPDGCVTAWNRGAERIIGYTTAEILGRSSDLLFQPGDRAAGVPREQRAAALASGRFSGEGWRCRAGGSRFWASVVMEPIHGADGGLIGFAKILRDTTDAREVQLALHESLRRSRLAEDTAQLGYWRIGLGDDSIVLSDWAGRIHGLAPDGNPGLAAVRQSYLAEDWARIDAAAASVIRGDAALDYRARIVWPDGAIRTVEVKGVAEREGGSATALFGTIRDVTDEVEASARLIAARDAATSAADARTDLLATMSHEIRTPMTGILGMLELLHDRPAGDDAAALTSIKQSARSLMVVLDDVLDHAALEQSEVALESVAFDLAAVLRNCAALFGATADAKGLTLSCAIDDSLPVIGDPSRIQQIVANFLSNAIKFTAAGGVAIACRRLPSGAVRIVVSDTGIGFDPTTAARLFTAYVQDDRSTRRRFGGTGLGLSICRRLAEAMGGTVGTDSVPGGGSRFWVDLPLETTSQPVVGSDSMSEPLATVAGHPPHVLVADDVETTRLVAEAHLRALGCQVTSVGDGISALECLAGGSYDVVLLDDHMPGLDGSSVAALAPQLPGARAAIVSFSASGSARPAVGPWAATLAKPFTRQSLRLCLASVLDGLPENAVLPPFVGDVLDAVPPPVRARLAAALERDLVTLGTRLKTEFAAGDEVAVRRTLHALAGCADSAGARPLAMASRFADALLAKVALEDCRWLGGLIDRYLGEAQAAAAALVRVQVAASG